MNESAIHHFADNGHTCVITSPHPPRHWYNYLWSEQGYCTQVSQMGHGRSYHLNAKSDLCMINNQDAKYLYLRDDDSGVAWNIGEGPLNVPVENFSCQHSQSHSLIASDKNGISASWLTFVPHDAFHEVWVVRLKNTSPHARRLSIFSAVTFELEGFQYPRYYEMYRSCETAFLPDLNGIYCTARHPFAPHARYNGYLASSAPVAAYDGDLAKFVGTTSTITRPDASVAALFQKPAVVTGGGDCTNSDTALFVLGAVLQNKLVLAPDEEKELTFVFGAAESPAEAASTAQQFFDRSQRDDAFGATRLHIGTKYDQLILDTPDTRINAVMNSWVKKQVDFCIVGKKGVRDNLQIAVGLLNFRPERARTEIIECLRHQFRAGHAVLTWLPYDDTRYSDQPFWIIWAVCELIKETGDLGLLDLDIEYQDGGSGTMREHLDAAVRRLTADKGSNGLVRILFADWNDALNITTDPEAESVMLSEQFCLALRELAALMIWTGDSTRAAELLKEYEILKEAINRVAWDGEWYVRALSRDEKIGSRDSEGSKIYLNAQSWAILADIPDAARLKQVLASIDSMEHEFGFPINKPPYQKYSPHVGRMSGMLPGLFENGGVYCHATGFKIMADCKAGRGIEALRTLKKIMPDSESNPSTQSGAEPYVFTNCFSIHPKYYGRSYQSWTTGTSAWALMGLVEGLLGIKRDYAGLTIAPCFPPHWSGATIRRTFRGTSYAIAFDNRQSGSTNVESITVDGEKVEGHTLPLFDDGKTHDVFVTLKA